MFGVLKLAFFGTKN